MANPSAPDSTRPAIAVIGTNRMGAPIAHNLIAAGFEVSVWDRSTDTAAALVDAGARLASSPAEAAEGADVVLTMLTDGETVAALMYAAIALRRIT